MPTPLVEGVLAALLTPRHQDGSLDEASFVALLSFLMPQGLQGLVINGATGEFCLTTPDELRRLLTLTRQAISPGMKMICGIGSTSVQTSCALAQIAAENGAAAVLLPAPSFFPYSQEDVAAFLTAVANQVQLPVLLYNLPEFTTPLEVDTILKLLRDNPNIRGIKDSSGSTAILEAVTATQPTACRVVGSDHALVEARERGLCDAVISGVACVMPELIVSIFSHSRDQSNDGQRLGELLQRLAPFPVPWGLKWLAEQRGVAPAHFAQALSSLRLEQARELQQWFQVWSPALLANAP